MTFKNSSGTILTTQENTDQYAILKGLTGYKTYLAELPSGEKNYILCHEEMGVVFETTMLEHIGAKIDMIALSEQFL